MESKEFKPTRLVVSSHENGGFTVGREQGCHTARVGAFSSLADLLLFMEEYLAPIVIAPQEPTLQELKAKRDEIEQAISVKIDRASNE